MEDASGLELTAQNVEATLDEIRWAAGLCLGPQISDQLLGSMCYAGCPAPLSLLTGSSGVLYVTCCLLIARSDMHESGLVLSLHCRTSLPKCQ